MAQTLEDIAELFILHGSRMHPRYWETLSADSQRSLVLQGGIYDKAECLEFIAQPGAAEAIKSRQWDDAAKQPGLTTPDLAHFLSRAARCRVPNLSVTQLN